MPDAECPDQSAPEYKSGCCGLVSVKGWFILFSTHELTGIGYESRLEKCVCLRVRVCVVVSKHKALKLRAFHIPKERQVRLLFSFSPGYYYPSGISTGSSTINHYTNQVSLTSTCTYESHNPHAHTHTHSTEQLEHRKMPSGNNMRACWARGQIHYPQIHVQKPPAGPSDVSPPRDLSGVSPAEELIQECVCGRCGGNRLDGADLEQHSHSSCYRHKQKQSGSNLFWGVRPFPDYRCRQLKRSTQPECGENARTNNFFFLIIPCGLN